MTKRDLSELPPHLWWYGITERESNGKVKYFRAEDVTWERQQIASILQEVWRQIIREHDLHVTTSIIDDMWFYRTVDKKPDMLLFTDTRKRFDHKLWYIPTETFISKVSLNAFIDPFASEDPAPEPTADAIRKVREVNWSRFADKRIEIDLNPLFMQWHVLETASWSYPYSVKPSLKLWNYEINVPENMILAIVRELSDILDEGSENKAKQLITDVLRSVK